MKQSKFLWYLLAFALIFTACSKDDDDNTTTTPAVSESEVLVKYLESTDSPIGKDYINSTDMPSIISAEAVHNDMLAATDMTLIDIRSATDFAAGHVEGAVNVAAGEVLNYVENEGLAMDHKIVVMCYTGQTAGWVTCILRLNGYKNAFSMLWGMSSWNSFFAGKWDNNVANTYATLFEDAANAKNPVGNLPSINTGKTTGAEIFNARVADVISQGFDGVKISNATVFANPSNYYIINYWAEADYTDYGHIPGAVQYTPKETIKLDVDLKTIPTDKTVVVYCWTGQTSSFLATYLKVLGYDAKTLLFGANGMIYDELQAHKWSMDAVKEYDYVQ